MYKKTLLIGLVIVIVLGTGLLTWLPRQMGNSLLKRSQQSAFDYIKANAEKNIPEAAFLRGGLFRSSWDRFVAEYLTNGEILKVKAFDQNAELIYSTGKEKAGRERWEIFSLGKKMISELGVTKRITSSYGNEESVHAMRLIIPLYKNSQMIGVLEVVQDVDSIYKQVGYVQIGIGMAMLSMLLFLALILNRVTRKERAALAQKNLKLIAYDSKICNKLRTPLASIKGYATVALEDKELNEKEREEALKIIIDEADWLSRYIDELLDLTRIESGALWLNKKPVKIDALIQESVNRVSKPAEDRKVKIETKLPEEISEIRIDREKMVQALGNLLIASVMRSMAGDQVTLGAKYTEKGVQFEVGDNGEELSSEEISNLFDRIHWVESSQQKTVTGLELPLAKAIVEAHSGKMNVEGKAMEGSTFSFTLPMK